MKHRQRFAPALAAAVALGFVAALAAGAADKAKPTIKDVMKDYHKGDDALCKKVAGGKASKDELKKIVEAYAALPDAKPPKGDEKEWKDRATKLLDAAKGVQAGKADALAKYKDAVNCKACHTAHKAD